MFQLVLFGFAMSKCISITETTVCSPWSDMQIDADVLEHVYKPSSPLDAKTWEQLVIQSTTADQAELWKYWAGCTLSSKDPIPYARSYQCLTDIFLYSKHCNDGKTAPGLEEYVCEKYGNYLHSMESNENVCPKLDKNSPSYNSMSSNRESMCRATDTCKEYLDLSQFKDQKKIPGVDADSTCGMGTSDAVRTYCTANPGESCCQMMKSNTFSDSLSNAMKMWSAVTDAKNSGKGHSDMSSDNVGNIILIIVVALFCVFVIGLMIAKVVAIQKKSRQDAPQENTYNNLETQSDKEETLLTTAQLLYRVRFAYTPSLDDELELIEGDEIEMESIDDKGWGTGRNLKTNKRGLCSIRFMQRI
ncbi:hypothetical protein HDV01_005941 [Terramyces sp. JEL0728]|nr:hypothetical protein HDV01_005941 [Terramyces sp. JEL0728]